MADDDEQLIRESAVFVGIEFKAGLPTFEVVLPEVWF
jgi:hypothetical protein